MTRARGFACWMDGWDPVARLCMYDWHSRRRWIQMRCGGVCEMEVMEEAVVAREEVCFQLSGEGLGLGRVRTNEMILGVLFSIRHIAPGLADPL